MNKTQLGLLAFAAGALAFAVAAVGPEAHGQEVAAPFTPDLHDPALQLSLTEGDAIIVIGHRDAITPDAVTVRRGFEEDADHTFGPAVRTYRHPLIGPPGGTHLSSEMVATDRSAETQHGPNFDHFPRFALIIPFQGGLE